MKTAILLMLGILLPGCLLSQINSFTKDSATLRNLEYAWLIAEFKRDTSTISKMMDDSFISIGENAILNKREELVGMYKNISQRLKDKHIVDSLELTKVQVRIHGTTAIVTFIIVTKGKIKEIPFTDRRTRVYDVWIKKNSQWKAVSSQITPISKLD